MRKTEGYILQGANFYLDEKNELCCEMKLAGKGEIIYEKYKVDHDSSMNLHVIAGYIYRNNEQVE